MRHAGHCQQSKMNGGEREGLQFTSEDKIGVTRGASRGAWIEEHPFDALWISLETELAVEVDYLHGKSVKPQSTVEIWHYGNGRRPGILASPKHAVTCMRIDIQTT